MPSRIRSPPIPPSINDKGGGTPHRFFFVTLFAPFLTAHVG
jgi:hypothetical protein